MTTPRAQTYIGLRCKHCQSRKRYCSSNQCVACTQARAADGHGTYNEIRQSRRHTVLLEKVHRLEGVVETLRDRCDRLGQENETLRAVAGIPHDTATKFGLTRSEFVIFGALMSREIVSETSIRILLYSDRPDDEPECKVINVFICRMRKRLRAHDATIGNNSGVGWFIPAADKTRLRAILSTMEHDNEHTGDAPRLTAPQAVDGGDANARTPARPVHVASRGDDLCNGGSRARV